MRLALLTEIPAPYRIPLFNALAERLDLEVLFLRERNPLRPYELHTDEFRFAWRVLPGFHVTAGHRWLVVNRGVGEALRRARPDAVLLGGWNQPAFWQALTWARRRRLPRLLWVESTARDRRFAGLDRPKRAILGAVDAVVVPGTAARAYVSRLGLPDERIVNAPNAVDGAIFGRVERRPHDGCRVVAVGRLAHEKGLDVLVRAAEGLDVELVLAGVGPEEDRLRSLSRGNVRFLGHVARDDLPAVLADADVLAMPSRSDPWGMALNEAALAGLPLISTDAAGAALDLIEDGVNGFRVPPDDVAALRDALRRLCEDAGFRAAAGARSRDLAGRFTPEAWADAVAARCEQLRRRR